MGSPRSPAWRPAPLLVWRQPAVVLAALAAGSVLGAAVAAQPMYASASGTAALRAQVAAQCRWLSGVTVAEPLLTPAFDDLRPELRSGYLHGGPEPSLDPAATLADDTAELGSLHAQVTGLDAPVTTLVAGPFQAGRDPADLSDRAELVARDGALAHVELLTPRGRSGVWVSSLLAATSRLIPGGSLRLSEGGHQVSLPVAGIYRDIKSQPASPSSFWCSLARAIYYQPPDYVPPPLVIADPATVISVASAVRSPVVGGEAELGLRPGTTLAGASAVLRGLPAAARHAGLSGAPVEEGSGPGLRSSLGFETARAAGLGSAVRSGIGPVWAASVAAGLALLAAAGAFWAQKRRAQLRLFDSQGVAAAAVGAKAVLELGVPVVLGGAAGWFVARVVVGGLGPAAAPEGSAQVRAAVYAAAVLAGGLICVGAVVAAAVGSGGVRRRPRSATFIKWLPIEVVLLVAAGLAAAGSSVSQADGGAPTRIVSVGVGSVLFPLLVVAAAVVIAVRLSGPILVLARRAGYGPAQWLWLASRRLAHRPGLAALVVTVGTVPVALSGYGAGVSASTGATLRAKASVLVGSDVRVQLPLPAVVPVDLRAHATEVLRVADAQAGGSLVDVIGVDPATFAAGAYWDPSFAPGHTLAGLLHLLRAPGPLPPAVLAGPAPAGPLTVGTPGVAFPYRVAARVQAFPGLSTSLVVVERSRLAAFGPATSEEIWSKGSTAAVLGSLERAAVLTGVVVSRAGVLDATAFKATAWTVEYLATAAWVFAGMGVAGLALYVDARQRSRGRAYVLARRMGLRRRTHLLSLVVELGVPASVGVIAGCAIAVFTTRVIAGHLDSYRDLPPAALVRLPAGTLTVGALVIAAAIGACCVLAQRASDRARPSKVLRDAG